MSADNIDDYWTQQASALEKPSEPLLKVETIEAVEPLDDQFGVADPKTVPDVLYEALFGQPGLAEDQLAQASGNTAKLPPLHTYTILDAAKVINLPEVLETSGLEHRCLFKGAAFAELKGVAPWIVRLEHGNIFTRNLFTRSDAPWHLWDAEAGFYIRSHASLDELWQHFRKFTCLSYEHGKGFYLNIGNGRCLKELAKDLKEHESSVLHTLLNSPSAANLISVHGIENSSFFTLNKRSELSTGNFAGGEIFLSDRDIAALSRLKRIRLAETVAEDMVNAFPAYFSSRGIEQIRLKAFRTIEHMREFGFDQTHQMRHLAAWGLFYGENFETKDPSGELDKICRSKIPASDKFSLFARRMHQIKVME